MPFMSGKYMDNNLKSFLYWSYLDQNSSLITIHISVNETDIFLSCFCVCVFVCFWPHPAACGILTPWPGIELVPPALKAWSLNHGTTRKILVLVMFWKIMRQEEEGRASGTGAWMVLSSINHRKSFSPNKVFLRLKQIKPTEDSTGIKE